MVERCETSHHYYPIGVYTPLALTVTVDEVLLAQIKEIITPLGWTVERLIVRFLEWLVDPETQEEAIAWLMKAKEELGEK